MQRHTSPSAKNLCHYVLKRNIIIRASIEIHPQKNFLVSQQDHCLKRHKLRGMEVKGSGVFPVDASLDSSTHVTAHSLEELQFQEI